jgi:hypothetical protein
MPASSPRTTEKLRSSCDGCGFAKVKCNRGQPDDDCGRCSTLGLTCVYSPSRQFGKPPRKRPGASLDRTAGTEKRTQTAWTSETQNTREPAPTNLSNIVAAVPSLSCNFNATAVLGTNETNQQTTGFFPLLSLEDWQLDIMEPGPGFYSPSVPDLSNSESGSPHSCRRESYEVFRDLICPGPFLHAPESNSVTVSAQLDQVLHLNRTATDRLSQILKCPCAKSGHRAMVHASIVSRMLIWYQQAAGCTSSSSSPSTLLPSESAADTDTTTTPSLVQATGFTVEYVPVSVGTFNMDDRNLQAAFRNQLVLSELKKTASLIDMFMSQETSAESSVGGVASLYSHLGEWLRGEHARTVGLLRSRLNALNESLSH